MITLRFLHIEAIHQKDTKYVEKRFHVYRLPEEIEAILFLVF